MGPDQGSCLGEHGEKELLPRLETEKSLKDKEKHPLSTEPISRGILELKMTLLGKLS